MQFNPLILHLACPAIMIMKHLSMSLRFLLLLLTFIVSCTFGAKILVFSPTLSRSHMISNGRVADALAKDGHNVTLLEVEYMVPLKSLNASTQARVLHVHGPFAPDQKVDIQKLMAENSFDPPSLINTIASMYFLHDALNYACDAFLTREHALLEQLKAERFDMLITEQLSFCGSGLSPLLGIPTHILLNSAPIMEHVATLIGLPNPSSYVPAVLESNLPDRMTLGQRFQNLLRHLVASCFLHWGIDPTTGIYRRLYGPDFPDLRDVVKDSPLQLVSADEFVDFPRPLFPNAIYIGGLGSEETKKGADLSEPFRSVMTKGPRGVVYFSMGTVMRTSDMREQFKRNLFKVFGQLTDYQFIVKVEAGDQLAEELAKPLANVFTTTWAPQTALLNHPRLRLFITHGGYNSLMEAARAGIPLITMGFFADQYRNGRVAERNGWGMPFEKRLLLESADEFRAAILRVVEDPKYKENAKRAQLLVLNKPFSAYERLTQNIRFLELSGGRLPELLSHSRNMSTVELYNLDLLALGVCAALASMALWAVFAWIAWKWVGKRTAIWLWNRLNTLLPGEEEKQKKKIA